MGKKHDGKHAIALAHRERAELDALIDELVAVHADEAAAHARRVDILARAFDLSQRQRTQARLSQADMPFRSIVSELAVAVRVNDRTLQGQVDDAVRLMELFPATVTALQQGRISRGHAAAILDAGARLGDPGVRAGFEEVVLERAAHESTARLRAYARRLAERVEPFTTQERFDDANSRRTVSVTDLGDGTAELRAILATALAFGIKDRLDRQAKAIAQAGVVAAEPASDADTGPDIGTDGSTDENAEAAASVDADEAPTTVVATEVGGRAAKAGGSARDADTDASDGPVRDARTRDQVRADLLTDLLLTATPTVDPTTGVLPEGGLGAIRASVQVTVPVTTLTGVTEGGAELDGKAPIDPVTAKHFTRNAPGWDRVMTHPVTGTVLEVDRYHPSADQQRFLDARDVHCRWPGCRQPVRRCQVDHNHEWQRGGRTSIHNLAHLCVRHHTLKTETPWIVSQARDGTLRFTSPGGRDYLDTPPPRVVFTPDTEPPPF